MPHVLTAFPIHSLCPEYEHSLVQTGQDCSTVTEQLAYPDWLPELTYIVVVLIPEEEYDLEQFWLVPVQSPVQEYVYDPVPPETEGANDTVCPI